MKQLLLAAGIGILLGAALTAKFMPVKTEQVEKEVVRTNVVTKIIERPDGSKETVIVDHSTVAKQASLTVVEQPKYRIYLSAETDSKFKPPVYGLQISKQFFGPIELGMRVNTERQFGLVIGTSF